MAGSCQRMIAAFQDQLTSCKVSKGTIRFPLSEPVPVKLIARIAKFRAKEAIPNSSFDQRTGSYLFPSFRAISSTIFGRRSAKTSIDYAGNVRVFGDRRVLCRRRGRHRLRNFLRGKHLLGHVCHPVTVPRCVRLGRVRDRSAFDFPRGLPANVRNISASSDIAASCGVSPTASAAQRDTTASSVPKFEPPACSVACAVAGVSRRNAAANSSSLGVAAPTPDANIGSSFRSTGAISFGNCPAFTTTCACASTRPASATVAPSYPGSSCLPAFLGFVPSRRGGFHHPLGHPQHAEPAPASVDAPRFRLPAPNSGHPRQCSRRFRDQCAWLSLGSRLIQLGGHRA